MSTTTTNNNCITQEYFDELCLENLEIFEGTEEEAVQETVTQLQASSSSSSQLQHLTLTFPSSSNVAIRARMAQFQAALAQLAERDSHTVLPEQQPLQTIHEALIVQDEQEQDSSLLMMAHLFLVEDGFSILLGTTFVRAAANNHNNETAAAAVSMDLVLDILLSSAWSQQRQPKFIFRNALQIAMPRAMPAWMEQYSRCCCHNSQQQQQQQLQLLKLAYHSVWRCEANKKLWMKCRRVGDEDSNKTKKSSFASLLLDTLQQVTTTTDAPAANHETNTAIGAQVCQILTTLCTFDDFRTADSDGDAARHPVVQSGHAHVQVLAEQGAVATVHAFLLSSQQQAQASTAAIAATAVSALRALAIQDDVVQNMVAVGVLETARRLLQSNDDNDNDPTLPTAVLGLMRNVAANDDIKTTLCLGSKKVTSVVPYLVRAMQNHPAAALLQEHACGLIAAMALRKPQNAEFLIATPAAVHVEVVRAMRRHPDAVALQRQAALAIRNLVSRASPAVKASVLEDNNNCQVEETLRHVAGKHLACQDEVYAALRDLGLSVSSVHVQQHDDGKVTVQQGRQMFGERNPNFRPVFD